MIRNISGRPVVDTGTVIVNGDAVVEIEFPWGDAKHQVSLKFRTDDQGPQVRFGQPKAGRTVVHLANFPLDQASAAGGIPIGTLGESQLMLAFVIEPFRETPPGDVRLLNYTLYTVGVGQ